MRFSKICVTALALAVFLGLTGAAFAGNGAKKAQKGIRGKIVSVAKDHTSMVIETHGKKGAAGSQVTVTFAANCTVTLDGQASTVTALSAGERVMVSPSADSASDIKVHAGGAKKGKKAAA